MTGKHRFKDMYVIAGIQIPGTQAFHHESKQLIAYFCCAQRVRILPRGDINQGTQIQVELFLNQDAQDAEC